jgi:monoterpene epsilon-lactone hydrolase
MNTIYHNEYLADQAAMQAMRAELQLHPTLEFGPEARPVFDELIARTPAAQNVSYEAATVGGVPGWWCRPSNAMEGAAILYLHGGAYILGSAAAYRDFAGQIAARAKVAAFIADYRLAPEHRFPSAVDDAIAAYQGLSADGYSRLALVGDSAGGGLALSLLLLTTAASKTGSVLQPAAAAVMSPWTDLALTGDSIATRSSADPLITRDALEKAAQLYLGGQDLCDAQASPLYGDLTGLPPVRLVVQYSLIYVERFWVDASKA